MIWVSVGVPEAIFAGIKILGNLKELLEILKY